MTHTKANFHDVVLQRQDHIVFLYFCCTTTKIVGMGMPGTHSVSSLQLKLKSQYSDVTDRQALLHQVWEVQDSEFNMKPSCSN
jgi:hypothetical protein